MAEATQKTKLEQVVENFPVGRQVKFLPGHGAPEVTAKVTGHRTAGTKGTRSFSVFIETAEDRGADVKPKERSVRPGVCTLV